MFSEHGRGELCSPAGDRRSPLRIHINFGRENKLSADFMCVLRTVEDAGPYGFCANIANVP